MPIYQIKYERTALHTMAVEAYSEEEALEKYEEFDCIEDYENYGLRETVTGITKVEEQS